MLPELALAASIGGPVLVIAPTFSKIERLITDSSYIDKLENGRLNLLHFNSINRRDKSFEPVKNVFEKETGETYNDTHAFYPLVFGVYGGGGGAVYLLNEETAEQDNPFKDHDPERLESILIVDEWLSQEIKRLRTIPKQRVRGLGFGLLILSVILQAIINTSGFTI